MKAAYAVMAVTLAANDVSPWWLAWMIVGALLLAAAVVALVRVVVRMLRRQDLGALWPVWLLGTLVVGWCAVGWPQGWMGG